MIKVKVINCCILHLAYAFGILFVITLGRLYPGITTGNMITGRFKKARHRPSPTFGVAIPARAFGHILILICRGD